MAPPSATGPEPEIEQELKWRVDGPALQRIRAFLDRERGQARDLQQDNRFFDTPTGALRRQGMALRLRRENGRVIMTVKRQLSRQQHGLHQHEETEQTVAATCWQEDGQTLLGHLPLPSVARTCIGAESLRCLGQFHNHRLAYHGRGEEIALDTTSFPGGVVDHEVEIETTDPATSRARWERIFDQLGCRIEEQRETKFARWRRISTEGDSR